MCTKRKKEKKLTLIYSGYKKNAVPADRKYVKSHEWVKLDAGVATVGITRHAQDSLGEIVHADLPEVGSDTAAGTSAAALESVKAAAEIYSPISGTVVAINETLEDTPGTINKNPHDDGWLFKVEVSDPSPMDALMSASEYEATLEDQK